MSEYRDSVAIARLLAKRGVASRRKAEEIVTAGRVSLRGSVLSHPAAEVPLDQVDEVMLDGRPLPDAETFQYFLFYKPKGCLVAREDPEGRETIWDVLDGRIRGRVEAVGRLDYHTEGALLLTNDGDLAQRLLHPSTDVPKRYHAKVYRTPDERDLQAIREGIHLEDGRTKPARARILDATDKENAWVEITVTEGRNRLVRRMLAQLGHPVSKLRRESFATVSVRGMERGQVRPLLPEEVQRLRDLAGGVRPERAGRLKYKKGFARPKPKPTRPGRKKAPKGGSGSRA